MIEQKIDDYLKDMTVINRDEKYINLEKDREKANTIGYKILPKEKACHGCHYFDPGYKGRDPNVDGTCVHPKNDKLIGGKGDSYTICVSNRGVCPRFQAGGNALDYE